MQYKFNRACTRQAKLFINTFVVPVFNPARFSLGQIAAHGEGRVGQVQGAAVVGFLLRHVCENKDKASMGSARTDKLG